jgi:hypothetical protein
MHTALRAYARHILLCIKSVSATTCRQHYMIHAGAKAGEEEEAEASEEAAEEVIVCLCSKHRLSHCTNGMNAGDSTPAYSCSELFPCNVLRAVTP